MSHDSAAAEALLRTGVLVPVRVVEERITPVPDEGEFAQCLDIAFHDGETPEENRLDGTGSIETVGRGNSATHWIARLQGSQPLRAVDQ